jgi:2-amino-4-hydroxy-6-hydroxymethyldihydropteridine diphosphokinase
VGDSRANLARAIRALDALPGARVRGVSRLYRTRPVGVTNQPDFLNAVVALDVPRGRDPERSALALLALLKRLEQALGRQKRQRWGPREIDLDLLVFGRHLIDVKPGDEDWLVVPHPEARGRLFVLAPLADLAPRLRPPGWHETVESARRRQLAAEEDDAVQAVGTIS